MSLLQEAEAKNILIADFMNDVTRLNREVLSGSLGAVGEIWNTLDSHIGSFADDSHEIEFDDIVEKVGLRQATTLHLAHNFMERAYENFGESEMGFAPTSIPTAIDMFKSLAEFIDSGIKTFDVDDKTLDSLATYGRTLKLYERLIKETEEKARTSDGTGWIRL